MKKILLLFLVLIFGNSILAQNTQPNDCVNAIEICGNGTLISNASGYGDKSEVAGCQGQEHNSLWLKINIIQSGTLGFDLIPLDPNIIVDYDFWVYGPNASCGALGSPLRCCTTNPAAAGLPNNITGMNGTSIATTSGPGPNGNGYVRWLTVTAGQSYYVVIDRPVGEGGFLLQWTGSAMDGAGAFPIPPIANQIQDEVQCSISSNASPFNLNSTRSKINPDLINNTITFHTTLANAVDGINPLPSLYTNTSNPQRIYVRVTNNVGGCFSLTSFNLRVSPIPTANISLSEPQVCDGENITVTFSGTPGATVDYTVNGGATQSVVLDITAGTYLLTEPVTEDRTYSLIIAKVIDGNNNIACSSNPLTDTKTVTIKPKPIINGALATCLNDTTQLTGSGIPATTNPWTSSDTTIATVNSTGLVTGIAVGTSNITYTNNDDCSTTSTVTINPLPTISGISSICGSGTTQLTGSGTPATTNPWISSDPSIATVTSSGLVSGVSPGTTTITYTDINNCSNEFGINVITSNSTESATAVVSNYFDDEQTITVIVVGDATYLYSLDGGPFQTSNVFNHVSPGVHSVTIHDTDGCTDIIIDDILAISYPHFFTPNGDGYNDTWNIWSLSNDQPNSEIYIFDRYGKLLKQITPAGAGWDGTYNGHNLPSTDYWFTVKYNENGTEKIFRAHFSIKR
ncbi:MAG: T9SS type B sorting domain-containing protein [Flavobacterium sp.]